MTWKRALSAALAAALTAALAVAAMPLAVVAAAPAPIAAPAVGGDMWLADAEAIDPNSFDWPAADPTEADSAQLLYSSSRAARVIAHARAHLEDPYRFGAEGPRYWDCSSFVQHDFRQVGIHLPRTSSAQSRRGTFISKSNLRPGDLVFFKNTYKAGVSHVGIYIGYGKFIHDWPHGGVKISSLNYSYFRAHYWGAKRVL